MAVAIERYHFTDADHARFREQLALELEVLRTLLARRGFGDGAASLGAEVEFFLADEAGRACHRNVELREAARDGRLCLELARFDLELNLTPVAAAGAPFAALRAELEDCLEKVRACGAACGARPVTIGILPTLTPADLGHHALTDAPRYHALSEKVLAESHGRQVIRIAGEDPLELRWPEVTLEGACASFQLHLRVSPADYARVYNAAQLVTPLALAIGANSPLFLGHRLWDETRVALFKQSVEMRDFELTSWRAPARVAFGHGWVREGAWELFAESVALHAPIMPIASEEDATAVLATGGTPRLAALRLHQGTIWRWNRAIYDPAGGGHLRIEFRALPSGPTPADMLANGALLAGLAAGLAPRMDELLPALPFGYAERNFYRAAQAGLGATLLWPSRLAPSPRERDVPSLLAELLPCADEGLAALGVEAADRARTLGVIERRLALGLSPARWLRRTYEALCRRLPGPAAIGELTRRYAELAATGTPLHEWPAP